MPELSIVAPDPRPEGTGGSTPFVFTVNRAGDTSGASIVDYYLRPTAGAQGTADPSDFATSPYGSLYFAAGDTSKTLTLNVAGDSTTELDESFAINLSNARGATIVSGSAPTTILNDDGPDPAAARLSWGNPSTGEIHNEGDGGTTPFTFVVNRTGDANGPTSVDWRVNFDTANAQDFTGALNGTLTFAAGEVSKSFTVQVVGDTTPEPDETFFVSLSNAPGAVLPPQLRNTITNDDGGAPVASVSVTGPGSRAEGTGGTTPFDFTVTRSGDTTGSTLVDYYVMGDTNTADFSGPTAGTVYFNPGDTSKVIHLNVVGDSTVESDETFVLGLSNPRGGIIETSKAPAVILNDDGAGTPPQVQLSWGTPPGGITKPEGDAGTTAFTYTLNRSGDTSGSTTVPYNVSGQATADDFATPMSGTVTFAPGELSKDIVLQVKGDTVQEPDETFTLALGASPGATLPPQINGKIVNDDGAPPTAHLSISGGSQQPEGTGQGAVFDYSVTRTGPTDQLTIVDYYVLGDTANSADFVGPTAGSLYFNPGETTKVIHITAAGDSTPEPDESFTVGLSNARGGVIDVAKAPGVIMDDDGWVVR